MHLNVLNQSSQEHVQIITANPDYPSEARGTDDYWTRTAFVQLSVVIVRVVSQSAVQLGDKTAACAE